MEENKVNERKEDENSVAAQLQDYRMFNAEYGIEHHSYADEINLIRLFKEMDEKKVMQVIDDFPMHMIGKMATTRKKQEEYTAVLGITFCVRFAIQEGVDAYEAYAINDLYLQKISVATSIEQYRQLLKDGIRQLYVALRKAKAGAAKSIYVEKSKQYIARNISKKITLRDVADYAGISPNRLSALFSKEVGTTMKQYILQERVNAAKNMLRYSDYTIDVISEYLCFSSQSHFGRVFHQYTGMTPLSYRKENFVI